MLEGLMQNDFQLNVGAIRRRLRACYHDQEVVTMTAGGYESATFWWSKHVLHHARHSDD